MTTTDKITFIERNTPTISDAEAGAFSVAIQKFFSIFVVKINEI